MHSHWRLLASAGPSGMKMTTNSHEKQRRKALSFQQQDRHSGTAVGPGPETMITGA
jgi:hypothetical protein